MADSGILFFQEKNILLGEHEEVNLSKLDRGVQGMERQDIRKACISWLVFFCFDYFVHWLEQCQTPLCGRTCSLGFYCNGVHSSRTTLE